MKRALLIVMTIAILGTLGLYVNKAPTNSLSNRTSSTARTLPASTTASSATNTSSRSYKDGIFQGSAANTPYGVVQIAVVVSGGKITDVNFIQMPSDQGHSREVTAFAEPLLKQSTIQAQSPNIEFVSGATSTSEGYEQSLQAALNHAAA
ncbi:MAG TPA: FMN-binding protein [Candidatus Saccharimonadales bacterium]|nr:FMN-binding protein [Candidatus Saccharimonadales bacterium]